MQRIFILTLLLCLSMHNAGIAQSISERKEFLRQEIVKANSFIPDAALRQYKYQQMAASPFAFYRATAFLYYKDLSSDTIKIPQMWKNTAQVSTWLQGDFHVQNIGFFDLGGMLLFDLNDFDEAYVGPFYWDIIRLAASIFLIREELDFHCTADEAEELASQFLKEYVASLAQVHGNNQEIQYELNKSKLSGFVRETLDDLETSKSLKKLLKKWTVKDGTSRKFDFSNPDLVPLSSEDAAELDNGWASYLTDIHAFYAQNPDYFKIKDRAQRLHSGLGSLGVRRYYILLEGDSSDAGDDVILDVKEQRQPSMLTALTLTGAAYPNRFAHHAERSKFAYRGMRGKADPHVGILISPARSYLVQRISPWKFGYEGEDFKSQADFANFLCYTARALAMAHSRSDNDYSDTFVPYSFEKGALQAIETWPSAKQEMRTLAARYAEQVKADYRLFQELLAAGALQ